MTAYPSWWETAFDRLTAVTPARLAVLRWDGGDDADVVWINRAGAELFGVPPEALAGRRVSETYAAYRDEVLAQFRRARDEGVLRYTVVRELPEGRRTLDAITVSLGDDLYLSFGLDRTAQHEAERRLEQVTRMTGAGIYHWNVADGTVHWTDGMFQLLGYRPAEVEASVDRYLSHVHVDDRDEVAATTLAARTPGTGVIAARHRIVRHDGAVRTLDVRAEPTFDADGNPLYVLGVARDVTDEVELERHAELVRRASEQQRTALTVHDRVVQALATVVLALELGDTETARAEAEAAVAGAQSVVADLLREVAAVQGTVSPGALRVTT